MIEKVAQQFGTNLNGARDGRTSKRRTGDSVYRNQCQHDRAQVHQMIGDRDDTRRHLRCRIAGKSEIAPPSRSRFRLARPALNSDVAASSSPRISENQFDLENEKNENRVRAPGDSRASRQRASGRTYVWCAAPDCKEYPHRVGRRD